MINNYYVFSFYNASDNNTKSNDLSYKYESPDDSIKVDKTSSNLVTNHNEVMLTSESSISK